MIITRALTEAEARERHRTMMVRIEAEADLADDRQNEEIRSGVRCQCCERILPQPTGDTTICPECEAL